MRRQIGSRNSVSDQAPDEGFHESSSNGVFGGDNPQANQGKFGGVVGGGFGGGNASQQNVREADFTKLIDLINETVGEDQAFGSGKVLPFPSNSGSGIRPVLNREFGSFIEIGHFVWALLLGWIIGHASRFVYEMKSSVKL